MGSKIKARKSGDSSNLQFFNFDEMKAVTDDFSFENKLGQGGYGPVYKGKLRNGQEIAVKRLSETSTQGLEEFENEVILTAKLQHINLAFEIWKDGKGMEFIDESLDDTISSGKLLKCMQIALLCVQKDPLDRPTMLEQLLSLVHITVLKILRNQTGPSVNIPIRHLIKDYPSLVEPASFRVLRTSCPSQHYISQPQCTQQLTPQENVHMMEVLCQSVQQPALPDNKRSTASRSLLEKLHLMHNLVSTKRPSRK
ncbi:hypothetical protein RND71_005528 [Anisodus tanguticus]|uniref:Serine-threonine/tyrosine-protein kinase catalytic domain-containing protein n=1 Tax=Anisodus tanguticus TaxID=243964 RepID=A0AAE1SSB3_9SOLA|nr:hypothetical protein RND71_005528 [Anisodus tanguticus]